MEYSVKLDANDLGVVAEALATLPLGKSITTYNKILKQVEEQDKANKKK